MTVSLEEITARAVQLRPVRIMLWLVAAPFVALLFLLRFLWLIPAFLIGAGIEGWNTADRLIKTWQAQAREPGRR